MRTLVYYVATTIDGFIADPDGGADIFPNHPDSVTALFRRYPETCPVHLRPVFGIGDEAVRFDTVILGANTHRPAIDAGLTSGYPHLRQLVVTHGAIPTDPSVETVGGDLVALVRTLKAEPGADIWLCGGGAVAAQLIDEIDELQVKVNPVLLGAGIPLASTGFAPSTWELVEVEQLPAGVVLLTYRR